MSQLPAPALSLDSNNFYAHNVNNSVHTNQTVQHQVIHQTQSVSSRRDPIDILHEHVAFGALYNSKERFDPPKCHPQTRTAVLDRIRRWAAGDSEDLKPIMWLSGPAGAGKSAIAQTLVEEWKTSNCLALAFFFWRTSSERNQSTCLVPTLAFELPRLLPSIEASSKEVIEAGLKEVIEAGLKEAINAGGLFETTLAFQLRKLVVEPLCGIASILGQRPVVIVIDGLDECCIDLPKNKDFPGQTYESQQEEIIEAFRSACHQIPYLRLLIVSRPERQIRSSFGTKGLQLLTTSLSLKDTEDASTDVRLFLDCSFQEIRDRHGIDSSWPTNDQLSELVRKSSGQFIYPAIVVKHVTRARASPKQSLIAVLELDPGPVNNPLAELDMLYTLILRSVPEASLSVVTYILGYMMPNRRKAPDLSLIFIEPCNNGSLRMFEKLLFLPEGEAESHLDDLHSVLDIPPRATGRPITFIHATFSEHLQHRSRSKKFFISQEQVSIQDTKLLFRHLDEWCRHLRAFTYNESVLVDRTCFRIYECPPSRSLIAHIWSLMRTELGQYPLAGSYMDQDSPPPASKQLFTQFNFQLKCLEKLGDHHHMRGLLGFLQKCNKPEIEPSWLRRCLVRWRLEAALQKNS